MQPWPRVRSFLLSPRTTRPLAVALGTRVVVVAVAAVGLGILGPAHPGPFLLHGEQPHPNAAVDLFQRWDSYWFLNVARHGYHYRGVQEQLQDVVTTERETNITPFPLYPLLMAGGAAVLGDPSLAGLAISLACFLAACVLFYRRTASREGDGPAARAVLLLSVFPTAFIYNALYSESLFLLLSLLCLHAAEDGRPLRAGLFGAAASLARLAGGLLAPCILLESLRRREPSRPRAAALGLLGAALASLGWLGYFLYLRRLTGSFLVYFTAQRGWHKEMVPPWVALATVGTTALGGDPSAIGHIAAALLFVALAIWGVRRLPRGQALYLVLGVLMPLSSSNLLGLPRYLMVLFPAFLLAGRLLRPLPLLSVAAGLSLAIQVPVLLSWLRWQHSL